VHSIILFFIDVFLMWQIFSTIKSQDFSTPPPGIICQIDGKDLNYDANYTSFNITAEIE
jgi:hypothetical protein